jgi:hypothetical protein
MSEALPEIQQLYNRYAHSPTMALRDRQRRYYHDEVLISSVCNIMYLRVEIIV